MHPSPSEPDPERQAEALLERVAGQDREALAELYDRYARALFSISLGMTRNASDAEEILQKAFTKIWAKADTYDRGKGKASTWIITVTKRTALDHIRALKRRAGTLSTATEDPVIAHWVTAGSDAVPAGQASGIISSEDSRLVRDALANLPEEQRRVIELSFFQSMSQSEIASELGVPLGTIKSRIRRGMHTLRVSLSDRL